MLPRNPFNTTYAEMVDSSETFLTLFDYTALDVKSSDNVSLISEDMFERIVFFSSSPGGGKSSMFHFFSPDVLNSIVQAKNQNIDSYQYLNNLGVVTDDGVRLLGVQISCARGFETIEDIYEGGISKQIFFALLNVRILKEALIDVLALKKSETKDLERITITDIPAELSSFFDASWTGRDYYDWACQEEKKICISINNMESIQAGTFIHNYLSIIQLLDARKILFDGERIVDKVLIMLDDVHKLTQNQRSALRESLFTVRAHTGVWLAQRSYALEEDELLGRDGVLGRDYLSKKLEDQREGGRDKSFYKTLEAIADRRVKANALLDINLFRSCISDSIDWSSDKDSFKKLSTAYKKLQSDLSQYMSSLDIKKIVDRCGSTYEKAIILRAIKIFIDRKKNSQQLTFDDSFLTPSFEDIEKAENDSGIKSIAEYYLCIENEIPFYYGMDKLLSLSFNNVYQFLNYCGEIFERRLSYKYEAKKRQVNNVSPIDQDRIISRVSAQRWKELDVLYSDSRQIKTLLENIAYIGIATRKIGAASYLGGTYTGIGVRDPMLNQIINEEKYRKIKTLLATCISGNLLKMKTVKQGNKGEQATVFYLNRWLCVCFKLPLAYGGWKPCNAELLEHICEDPVDIFRAQLHYTDGGFFDE